MPEELPTAVPPPNELLPLRAQVAEQAKLIEQLHQRIAELEARLLGLTLIRNSPPLLVDTVPPVEGR